MAQKIGYSYRFIPGELATTTSAWATFQTAGSENYCDPDAVHFVPALGGCFLVVQDEQDPGWMQAVRRALPAPLKPPQSLVEDFWQWLQIERPLVAFGNKVMVIDDDPTILTMLRVVLESAGYSVQTFSDAQRALDALTNLSPDLMVVDLRMPGMDGRQFVHEIKDRELDSKIIIVSAWEAREAERELNADASLQKPFAPDDLVALAKSIGKTVAPLPVAQAS